MALLKNGSSGPDVRELQTLLNQLPGNKIAVNGQFDSDTQNAVIAFQKANNLKPDGLAGNMTMAALRRATTGPSNGDLITVDQLVSIASVPRDVAARFIAPLNATMRQYQITTKTRIAAFIATLAHESANFTRLQENLNYTAPQLAKTWPNRYAAVVNGQIQKGVPNTLANSLAGKPVDIANLTYANRMGNGALATGDGYRYRGHGLIMSTGKSAYVRLKEKLGLDFVGNPDLLLEPQNACNAAGLYWAENNLNTFADAGDVDGVRDVVNIGRKTKEIGDAIGYADCKRIYDRAMAML